MSAAGAFVAGMICGLVMLILLLEMTYDGEGE